MKTMRFVYLIPFFVVRSALAVSDASPSYGEIHREFRETQSFIQRSAAQDEIRLKNHLEKMAELRHRLILPQEVAADAALAKTVAQDREALALATQRRERAETILNGAFIGIPVQLRGDLKKIGTDGRAETFSRSVALLAGEQIRSGEASSALLYFPDGLRVRITPESTFELVRRDATETHYALRAGRVNLQLEGMAVAGVVGRVFIHTPTNDMELRDASVTVGLDGADRTHLSVAIGTVVIAARRLDSDDQGRPWWLTADLNEGDRRPLLFGKWLRLWRTEGLVQIIRPDGIARKATLSAELPPADSLRTGTGARAWGYVAGDYAVALKELSFLRPERLKKQLRCRLDFGSYHFAPIARRSAEIVERPLLIAPDSSAQGDAHASLDVTVATGNATDWVPLDGGMDIRAGAVAAPLHPASW